MSLSSSYFVQYIISVLKGYAYSLKTILFPSVWKDCEYCGVVLFQGSSCPPKLLFLQRTGSQTSLLFLRRHFFQESSEVYSLHATARQWWILRKNKYLCSLCCPNKKCKKKNRKQHMMHRMARRHISYVLDKKPAKGRKINRNFSKYIKAERSKQRVSQDRKLSRYKREGEKVKKLNFDVISQFLLWRGLKESPAFR